MSDNHGVQLERSLWTGGKEYVLAHLGGVGVTDCYVDHGTDLVVEVDVAHREVLIRRVSDGELMAVGIVPGHVDFEA